MLTIPKTLCNYDMAQNAMNTFQINPSPKFQAILVDFKVFKTLSIKP